MIFTESLNIFWCTSCCTFMECFSHHLVKLWVPSAFYDNCHQGAAGWKFWKDVLMGDRLSWDWAKGATHVLRLSLCLQSEGQVWEITNANWIATILLGHWLAVDPMFIQYELKPKASLEVSGNQISRKFTPQALLQQGMFVKRTQHNVRGHYSFGLLSNICTKGTKIHYFES